MNLNSREKLLAKPYGIILYKTESNLILLLMQAQFKLLSLGIHLLN